MATASCSRLGSELRGECSLDQAPFMEPSSVLRPPPPPPPPPLDDVAEDERRRYYRLTDFGSKVLTAEIARLDSLIRAARLKGAFPMPKSTLEGT
jgi:hypothetical protein